MKKKTRKLLKKNLKTASNAFSLVELSVSLIVIAVIVAALMPVISKRLTSSSSIKNRISSDCDGLYPDGYCAMCYVTPKSCVTCTRVCNTNEYKNVSNCICEKCSTKYGDMNCVRCNSKKCLQCDNGYYLDSNNKCVICPKGHYCYQNGETSTKEACKKGTVAPLEGMSVCDKCVKSNISQTGNVATSTGMSSCVNCSAGTYAKNDAQGSVCEACPVGYYCPSGKLIPCAKGYYNAATKQTACKACTKSSAYTTGSVAPFEGMASCNVCTNGNYASSSAQGTSCTTCPRGYYCPEGKIIPCPRGTANGASGQSICVDCNKSTSTVAGNVAVSEGQTSCSTCGAGTYAKINRQTISCATCPAGMACSNGRVVQCGVGYYSYAGATGCSVCPTGSTSNAGANGCVNCSAGCSACAGNAASCTSCKAGYYKNGNSCAYCTAGYYCVGGTAGRVACPAGSTSSAGASSCKKCSDFSAQCTACTASGCTKCADGYKVEGKGCKADWNCTTYGGTVTGKYCWKEVEIGTSCSSQETSAGHTWRDAESKELFVLQKSSLSNPSYTYNSKRNKVILSCIKADIFFPEYVYCYNCTYTYCSSDYTTFGTKTCQTHTSGFSYYPDKISTVGYICSSSITAKAGGIGSPEVFISLTTVKTPYNTAGGPGIGLDTRFKTVCVTENEKQE